MSFRCRFSLFAFYWLLCCALSAFVMPTGTAQAATFVVNTTLDNAGTCTASSCTLRQAVNSANAASGDDTITFSSAFDRAKTITFSKGEMVVSNNGALNITGPGSNLLTLNGNDYARFFYVGSGANLSVSGVHMTHGDGHGTETESGSFSTTGGAVAVDSGTLALASCLIDNGGKNSTKIGGAVYCRSSTLYLTNCMVSNNTAEYIASALYIENSTATITGTTCSDNICSFGTEAIQSIQSSLTVNNSTFSGNAAYTGDGGSFFTQIALSGAASNTVLDSCTITAKNPPQSGFNPAVGISTSDGRLEIRNSIIAGNKNGTAQSNTNQDIDYSSGTLINGGHNLIGSNSSAEAQFPGAPLVGTAAKPVNPKLGPLADNGGATLTCALLGGSPAINAGATSLTFDQRRQPRPHGSAPDIGAYEEQQLPPSIQSVTITPTAPRTDDILTANVVASDPENDSLTYTFVWKRLRNGKTALLNDTTANLSAKTYDVAVDDVITVTVIASDGVNTSAPVSASITIQPTPIVITKLTLAPTSPKTDETLKVSVAVRNPDGKRLTYSYIWLKNGDVVQSTNSTTLSQDRYDLLANGQGERGDKITVIVVAASGDSNDFASAGTTVANSSPVLSSVALSPTPPQPTQTLTASYIGSDADMGDTLTPTYKWSIGSRVLTAEKGATLDLAKYSAKAGDVVTVEVRLSDGTAPSNTIQATATVSSAMPASSAPSS